MNAAMVDAIVKAVLYEGYMLYPLRPSAVKNRQPFNFGVVYPRVYSDLQHGTDAWTMQTECLVQGSDQTDCSGACAILAYGGAFNRETAHAGERADVNNRSEHRNGGPIGNRRQDVTNLGSRPWKKRFEVTEFDLAALATQPMQWPFRFPRGENAKRFATSAE